MNKTNLVLSTLALAAVGGRAVAQTAIAGAEDQRPNILYIMCDDHAMQCISAYGSAISKLAPTPNIDRLAQRGMLFNNCFVENSLSAPSRACLITGQYSHQNGQRQLLEGIDATQPFFSEMLHDAGYETAIVGKWHLMTEPKGFDYYHVLDDQGKYYNPMFCSTGHYGEYKQEMGYATTLVTEHSIDFLEHRDKSKPFLLMVHHKAPHRNWFPDVKNIGKYADVNFPLPSTFWDDYSTRGAAAHTQKMSIADDMEMVQDLKVIEMYDKNDPASRLSYTSLRAELDRMTPDQRKAWDNYYMPRNYKFLMANLTGKALAVWKYQNYIRDYMATIASVDESVGQLLDYLEKNNLDKNTIVVYTSDQGFYMGEHGWFDKRFMYEESLRTPLVVRYPKAIKPGTVDKHLVQNIDFAPTLLDVAGVTKPETMSGRSFLDLFDGKGQDWRQSIYYHYYDYPAEHHVRRHDGVRTDRYKLIHFYGAPMEGDHDTVDYEELYDMQNDPNELNNLYGKKGYEKITKELKKALKEYRKNLKVDEY